MSTPSAPSTHATDQHDLVEWYFEQGWTDGLPVVPPTPDTVGAMVDALGGDPDRLETRVPPRWGNLTREVLAVNLVLAGCKPSYARVVRAAMLAMSGSHFNLNGIQATTHMAAPLLIVNGPIRHEIGMNAGANVFGSGNRANATIGRALRLIMLNVGGGWPGDDSWHYPDRSARGPRATVRWQPSGHCQFGFRRWVGSSGRRLDQSVGVRRVGHDRRQRTGRLVSAVPDRASAGAAR